MPFQNTSELPDSIRSRFGAEGQRAFVAAFNSAFAGTCKDGGRQGDREACSFAVATTAAQGAEKADKEKALHGHKKPKRRKFESQVRIIKADDEQQILFGVVLEPDVEDSQGDVITAEDVELAAHRFAVAYALGKSQLGLDHEIVMDRQDAILVETFLAPVEFTQGDAVIRKGAWVIGVHIPDSQVWQSVKDSERTGFSIGGTGEREAA